MPSGRVHSLITLTLTPITTPAAIYYHLDPALYLLGGAIGLVLTPDLDVDGGSRSNHYVRRISPLLETVWRFIWWPYSKVFAHRSIWSHFPILSTLIRLFYLGLWVNLFYGLYCWGTHQTWSPYIFWNWSVFAGLAQADIWHYTADQLSTLIRRNT